MNVVVERTVGFAAVLTVIAAAGLFWVGQQFYFKKTLDADRSSGCDERVYVSRDADELFQLGQDYFEGEKDYDLSCAQVAYTQAISFDTESRHVLVRYQLGRTYFLQGRFIYAIRLFEEQKELFEDAVPNVYYMLGLTYGYKARKTAEQSDWQKAEDNFKKAVAHFPSEPWPIVDLAWVYFAQAKYEEMEPLVAAGLQDHPDNAWLLNMYGLVLLNTADQADGAHQYFLKAATQAEKVSVFEWGRNYPGNNPASWELGLAEMKKAIAKNVSLAAPSSTPPESD